MKRKTPNKQIRDMVFGNSGGSCECSNIRHKEGWCGKPLERDRRDEYDFVNPFPDISSGNPFGWKVICRECMRLCYPNIQRSVADIEKAIRKARLKNL